ncbi:hypothetical protein AB7M35_001698 [Amorphus suaedae]
MSIETGEPRVGIFWSVTDGARNHLCVDATPLGEAEWYGEHLTHSRGHFEVWEEWRRTGVSGLKRLGLPAAIAFFEYEDFPRGRVVFDRAGGRFKVYADPRIQGSGEVGAIVSLFGLDGEDWILLSDEHYRPV